MTKIRQALILWAFLLAAGLPPRTCAWAQDILTTQLQQGFGQNKVRYKNFDWWILESKHFDLYYEPEFAPLAERAAQYLEEGYDHISQVMRHELSAKPPIVIFKSPYVFQQTNIVQDLLPPGVAGFAEPLRYRMVIPFDGDLDNFHQVLVHEFMHIFEYDILYKGPVKRLSNSLSEPPTWIMEGLAEYATQKMSTLDEMVLRDAVLTDQLIPLKVMDSAWGTGNVFLAYKESHSLLDYIAANYGPEKISRILRVWDSQNDTDKLLKRLIDMNMDELEERWSASLRKQYWPLLKDRDYLVEIAQRISGDDKNEYQYYDSPKWSLSGDMLAVLSADGVEQNVDIIRLRDGSLVERITSRMRTTDYDELTFAPGTVAWSPDGRTIAFVAKKGPADRILLWDVYAKKLRQHLGFDNIEMIEDLAWSPDSQRLAFVGNSYGQSDLYMVDLATRGLTQLTGTPQREDYPAWSPDGTRIAYSCKQNGQFDIRVYDLATAKSQVVVHSPTDDRWPNWLPEGNKLLFVSTRDGIDDLFLYHLDEQREYRLTRTISGIMSPALSPDGKQIVMTTYYRGRRELYRMDMPDWPQVKKKSAELAARAQDTPSAPDSSQAVQPARPDTVQLLARLAPADSARAAGIAVPLLSPVELGRAIAQLDDPAQSAQAVKLAAVAQPLAPAGAPALAATPGGAAPDSGGTILLPKAPAAPDSADGQSLVRHRYTPRLEFDGVSLQMGYFGGILSSVAQLSMSDLLGNHSLALATDYMASQEINNDFNFAISYTYYGRRPTCGVAIFNWNQFYNDASGLYSYRNQLVYGLNRSRQSGLLANLSYPLDVYRRLDLSYTFVVEQQELVWPVQQEVESLSTHLFKAAYVHDSVNYGLLGPTSGQCYFLSAGRTLNLSANDRSFSHLELDYRHYLRLGRWSVLGLRANGIGSLGRDGLQYNLGGPAWFLPFYSGFNLNAGPLRGYDWSQFSGSRVMLLNAEVRVPFVRNILFGWPGTFSIPAVDGSFFVDVGGAWNKDETLDLWPLHNPYDPPEARGQAQRLHAGMGVGLLVYFGLPLNFEFARQTDFNDFSDYHFHFSFGKSF